MSEPDCYYCTNSATKLCDWIESISAAGWWMRRGKGPGRVAKTAIVKVPYANLDSEITTCDRPLCGNHAVVQSQTFACGTGGCDVDTRDYCPEHHARMLVHGERMPKPH